MIELIVCFMLMIFLVWLVEHTRYRRSLMKLLRDEHQEALAYLHKGRCIYYDLPNGMKCYNHYDCTHCDADQYDH